mmetsp:Transcript_66003/g.187446  ORF Transcript_66003/g.187446 Transcript_66003/m.187446 type:complete len:231 (-) Transcript_66003:424-1116(-)
MQGTSGLSAMLSHRCARRSAHCSMQLGTKHATSSPAAMSSVALTWNRCAAGEQRPPSRSVREISAFVPDELGRRLKLKNSRQCDRPRLSAEAVSMSFPEKTAVLKGALPSVGPGGRPHATTCTVSLSMEQDSPSYMRSPGLKSCVAARHHPCPCPRTIVTPVLPGVISTYRACRCCCRKACRVMGSTSASLRRASPNGLKRRPLTQPLHADAWHAQLSMHLSRQSQSKQS